MKKLYEELNLNNEGQFINSLNCLKTIETRLVAGSIPSTLKTYKIAKYLSSKNCNVIFKEFDFLINLISNNIDKAFCEKHHLNYDMVCKEAAIDVIMNNENLVFSINDLVRYNESDELKDELYDIAESLINVNVKVEPEYIKDILKSIETLKDADKIKQEIESSLCKLVLSEPITQAPKLDKVACEVPTNNQMNNNQPQPINPIQYTHSNQTGMFGAFDVSSIITEGTNNTPVNSTGIITEGTGKVIDIKPVKDEKKISITKPSKGMKAKKQLKETPKEEVKDEKKISITKPSKGMKAKKQLTPKEEVKDEKKETPKEESIAIAKPEIDDNDTLPNVEETKKDGKKSGKGSKTRGGKTNSSKKFTLENGIKTALENSKNAELKSLIPQDNK